MRTGNPTLRENTFNRSLAAPGEARMTLSGTVNKTFLLLVLLLLSAGWTWSRFNVSAGADPLVPVLMGVGAIGGLITALVCAFWRKSAPFTAPVYALLEGLLLGGLSAMMELKYPGIVLQAVVLTAGTLGSLLFAYMTGAIKATENFKLGVVAATGAVFFIYLGTWIASMFGIQVPYIHDNGTVGILISLAIVVIAALNLVLDFDFIEQGAEVGAPKYMEWYGAFGLMVTLVWLYIEILRLLGKLRR